MSTGRRVLVLADTFHADTPYDEWAGASGAEVWLLVSAEKAAGYAHLPHVEAFPGWWTNPDVEARALEVGRAIRPVAVVARCEPDILRAARVREALGVPGQGLASALAFRDKVVQKDRLRRCGLAVPACRRVGSAEDLRDFIAARGYPVVVKPACRSGSVDTHILRSADDLAALLALPLASGMEAEAFVGGQVYAVEGLAADGQVVAAFAAAYVNSCLSYTRGEYHGFVLLPGGDPLAHRLIAFARRVLAALPGPEAYAFHVEAFVQEGGRLVVCEAASRTPGGRANAAIRAATGFDLDRAWWDAQMRLAGAPVARAGPAGGDRVAPAVQEGRTAGYVMVYSRPGVLAAVPDPPPAFVVDARLVGGVGQRYRGPVKSGDYLAAFVVVGESAAQVEQRVHAAGRWFQLGAEWA